MKSSRDHRDDGRFMALALRLAAEGRATVSPNPMVGALLVSRGRVLAQAHHVRPGEPHAEALVLQQAGAKARGATLYLTLEPCCHTNKRTPPCLPLVQAAGLARVVIAMRDPNPAVSGRSIRALQRAKIPVTVGCCVEDAEALNHVYIHWMRTGRPWVISKAGMTLDGKIATATGESQWITGAAARADAHGIRSTVDAVLVGVETAITDDPQLTARVTTGRGRATLAARQPMRVLVDSRLRLSPRARLFCTPGGGPVLVATTAVAPRSRRAALTRIGVEVVTLPAQKGRVSLPALLRLLSDRRVSSLLVEGGGEVTASLLRARLIDEIRWYVAPRILGGQDARSVIGGRSPASLADAVALGGVMLEQIGDDLAITGRVLYGRR
ncbi:MAG: bifunctional diaminohydroxyphosphoribosylaminopyrimidine deaminase/5-amino-6-(5-phosphoribosylamino)uracil reductase RibD [Nitrospiraceae bacterium]